MFKVLHNNHLGLKLESAALPNRTASHLFAAVDQA